MTKVVVAALAATLFTSSLALAQEPRPSRREGRYATGLAERLGRPVEDVRRVSIPLTERLPFKYWPLSYQINPRFDPNNPAHNPPNVAPALQVRLGPAAGPGSGLTLTRIKFPDVGMAQYHFRQYGLPSLWKVPVMAELRGDQIILVAGEALRDPELVRELREKMWQGLPTPPGPQAAATHLDAKNFVVTTRSDTGGKPVVSNVGDLHYHTTMDPPGANHVRGPGRPLSPVYAGRGHAQWTADGVSVWLASDPASAQRMLAHFAALGGHPAPPQAPPPGPADTPGAKGTLDGLFGGAP